MQAFAALFGYPMPTVAPDIDRNDNSSSKSVEQQQQNVYDGAHLIDYDTIPSAVADGDDDDDDEESDDDVYGNGDLAHYSYYDNDDDDDDDSLNAEYRYKLIEDGLYWIQDVETHDNWILAHESHFVVKFCRRLHRMQQKTKRQIEQSGTTDVDQLRRQLGEPVSTPEANLRVPGILGYFVEHISRPLRAELERSQPLIATLLGAKVSDTPRFSVAGANERGIAARPYTLATDEHQQSISITDLKSPTPKVDLEEFDAPITLLDSDRGDALRQLYTPDELKWRGHLKEFSVVDVLPSSVYDDQIPLAGDDSRWFTISTQHYTLYLAYVQTLSESRALLVDLIQVRDNPERRLAPIQNGVMVNVAQQRAVIAQLIEHVTKRELTAAREEQNAQQRLTQICKQLLAQTGEAENGTELIQQLRAACAKVEQARQQ